MRVFPLLPLLLLPGLVPAPAQAPPSPLTATDIMQRVVHNQAQTEAERSHYVYLQHAVVSSRHGHKVLCQETTDTRITPAPSGTQRRLLTLQGSLWRKDRYLDYTRPVTSGTESDESEQPLPQLIPQLIPDSQPKELEVKLGTDDPLDIDLVENLRSSTLTNPNSKDGINAGLFPLTARAQQSYSYRLLGRESMNGRDTFHIAFKPKNTGDFDWQGDAWIDVAAFQPVLVRTRLARGVPFAVKALLGTNVPGLGFAITYAPQPDGTWFPITFGTEFKIHVLFFFSRDITISATNRDFQKTHVDSRILSQQQAQNTPTNTLPSTVTTNQLPH